MLSRYGVVSALVLQGVMAGACGRGAANDAPVVASGATSGASASSVVASASVTATGETTPVASVAPSASAPGASEVSAVIPATALAAVLGCWKMPDGEVWNVRREGADRARVTRTLASSAASRSDGYAERAARPAELHHSGRDGSFGFASSGRIHALLFVFSVTPEGLRAVANTSFAPGDGYPMRGAPVTLHRC